MVSLANVLIYLLVEVICYGVGRALISLFTFGRIRCERFGDSEDLGLFGRRTTLDGIYVLPAWITIIAGLVGVLLAIILGTIAYRG
jgi:hypothetical protein